MSQLELHPYTLDIFAGQRLADDRRIRSNGFRSAAWKSALDEFTGQRRMTELFEPDRLAGTR
jgi:hypothetical protein